MYENVEKDAIRNSPGSLGRSPICLKRTETLSRKRVWQRLDLNVGLEAKQSSGPLSATESAEAMLGQFDMSALVAKPFCHRLGSSRTLPAGATIGPFDRVSSSQPARLNGSRSVVASAPAKVGLSAHRHLPQPVVMLTVMRHHFNGCSFSVHEVSWQRFEEERAARLQRRSPSLAMAHARIMFSISLEALEVSRHDSGIHLTGETHQLSPVKCCVECFCRLRVTEVNEGKATISPTMWLDWQVKKVVLA
mmetsp:Transcript_88712/g.159943  ORF Transcript_88712/g.159943 Transcript_88712/m.159943 type:complete len:249 (+) Transcript_88712:120-866(+)